MRFLFVDDEPKILEGLERSLLMEGDEDWDVRFAGSGSEAVAVLESMPIDAMVTDMRMPGMDGAALLRRAQEIAPGTARIVLSGQMEGAAALDAMQWAHQILSKPCSVATLCDVLRSSVRYRALLDSDALRRAVLAADRLPAAPTIYREIEAELRQHEPSVTRLAAIASRDPGLTARLMQVASSPFFGGGGRMTSVTQVISRLGLQVLSALALAAVFDGRSFRAREIQVTSLAERAFQTAAFARALRRGDEGPAYLTGMLTEVGHLVIATAMPAEYDQVTARARAEDMPHEQAEREAWGTTHAEVGAYLIALWGMPVAVADAVGAHHHAPAFAEPVDRPLAAAVALAAAIADGREPDPGDLAALAIDRDQALEICQQR